MLVHNLIYSQCRLPYCSHKRLELQWKCIVHDCKEKKRKKKEICWSWIKPCALLWRCVMSAHKRLYKCLLSQSGCCCLGNHHTRIVRTRWPPGHSTTSPCTLYMAQGPIPAYSLHLKNNNNIDLKYLNQIWIQTKFKCECSRSDQKL